MGVSAIDPTATANAGTTIQADFAKALTQAQQQQQQLTPAEVAAMDTAAISVMTPLLMIQYEDILGDAMGGGTT